MRKRIIRTGRKKGVRQSRADPKLYHGERARFHYYQCLQLVLRKQIAALITLWDLPAEFERYLGFAFDSSAETAPCGTLPLHAGAEG